MSSDSPPWQSRALHNRSRWTNLVREYAIGIRRSPIWNILVQSALSITSRHNGLLRIVQKDVTNWRVANADCVFSDFPPICCAKPSFAKERNSPTQLSPTFNCTPLPRWDLAAPFLACKLEVLRYKAGEPRWRNP